MLSAFLTLAFTLALAERSLVLPQGFSLALPSLPLPLFFTSQTFADQGFQFTNTANPFSKFPRPSVPSLPSESLIYKFIVDSTSLENCEISPQGTLHSNITTPPTQTLY